MYVNIILRAKYFMKSPRDAFGDMLGEIHNAVLEGRYTNASNSSADMINLAYNLECVDEVFIAEVLEGIFMQMEYVMKEYDITNEERLAISSKVAKAMEGIIEAYGNKQDICSILKKIRYDATTIAFDAPKKFARRRRFNRGNPA